MYTVDNAWVVRAALDMMQPDRCQENFILTGRSRGKNG